MLAVIRVVVVRILVVVAWVMVFTSSDAGVKSEVISLAYSAGDVSSYVGYMIHGV